MNNLEDLTTCVLTEEVIRNRDIGRYFSYDVNFGGKDYSFNFCKKCIWRIQNELGDDKFIFQGLLLNGRLKGIDESVIHWEDDPHPDDPKDSRISLRKEIDEAIYPKNPKDKFDNLFNSLFKKYAFDVFRLNQIRDDNVFIISNYLKNVYEFNVYFKALVNESLVDDLLTESSSFDETLNNTNDFRITYQGLIYLKNLSVDGFISNKCFVAMAFQDETKPIREAIRSALLSTGFEPIFIDEKHISSEKTINDEIISNLKKCKFCVADFSHHKNGVYFESGFALGQGKPVIYTCEKEEFKNAHFDIKPLQHIIYSSPEELKFLLISKIEAWIK